MHVINNRGRYVQTAPTGETSTHAQVRIVYLEDIGKTISKADKLRALLSWKKPIVARTPDDWAAILFTSGSEGTPKGVVLSHANMLANRRQLAARVDFSPADHVLNALPVFHSFGQPTRRRSFRSRATIRSWISPSRM